MESEIRFRVAEFIFSSFDNFVLVLYPSAATLTIRAASRFQKARSEPLWGVAKKMTPLILFRKSA